MTTTRTYQCNLCHDPINVNGDGTKGRGVYFNGYSVAGQPWFKFVPVRDAEHHLCERCIAQTKEAA